MAVPNVSTMSLTQKDNRSVPTTADMSVQERRLRLDVPEVLDVDTMEI
jgi:hypothetical protein